MGLRLWDWARCSVTAELQMGGGSVLPAHLRVSPWQRQLLSFRELFAVYAVVAVPKAYLSRIRTEVLLLCSLFSWLRVTSST